MMEQLTTAIEALVAERDAAISGCKALVQQREALAAACPRFEGQFCDSRRHSDSVYEEIAAQAVEEVYRIASDILTGGRVAPCVMRDEDDGFRVLRDRARGAWPTEKRTEVWLSADLHAIAERLVLQYPAQRVEDRLDREAATQLASSFALYARWNRCEPKVSGSGISVEVAMSVDRCFSGSFDHGSVSYVVKTNDALRRFTAAGGLSQDAQRGMDDALAKLDAMLGSSRAKVDDLCGRHDLGADLTATIYKSKVVYRFSRPVGEKLMLYIRLHSEQANSVNEAA